MSCCVCEGYAPSCPCCIGADEEPILLSIPESVYFDEDDLEEYYDEDETESYYD